MSEPTPPAPRADDLARQLQAALKQRRPRPWLPVIAALVVATATLSFLVWWMYPRRTPESLQVVALDAVFTPDETPRARAQLLLPPENEDHSHLRGQTIVFFEPPLLGQPGAKPREGVVRSDAKGQASFDWPVAPPETMAEVLVRYINAEQRQASMPDRGRLYVWPKDAPILVVDADETLIGEQLDDNAQTALQGSAQDGWRVVYLCLAGADANEFRQARGWVQTQPGLPLGPVLSRAEFPGDRTVDQQRRDVLASLTGKFRGPIVAVVKSTSAAVACHESGVRTILIADANRPAGVLHAPTWKDVPAQLK